MTTFAKSTPVGRSLELRGLVSDQLRVAGRGWRGAAAQHLQYGVKARALPFRNRTLTFMAGVRVELFARHRPGTLRREIAGTLLAHHPVPFAAVSLDGRGEHHFSRRVGRKIIGRRQLASCG